MLKWTQENNEKDEMKTNIVSKVICWPLLSMLPGIWCVTWYLMSLAPGRTVSTRSLHASASAVSIYVVPGPEGPQCWGFPVLTVSCAEEPPSTESRPPSPTLLRSCLLQQAARHLWNIGGLVGSSDHWGALQHTPLGSNTNIIMLTDFLGICSLRKY